MSNEFCFSLVVFCLLNHIHFERYVLERSFFLLMSEVSTVDALLSSAANKSPADEHVPSNLIELEAALRLMFTVNSFLHSLG